jgi:CheY-like chemotaxis protein
MGNQIILVDDDADDREFLVEAMLKNRYQGNLLQADNGLALLTMLDSTREEQKSKLPDLIVLDLNMPLLNGYEVLSKLKSDDDYNKIPVVVLTSSAKKEDEEWCKKAGCFKYYKKPYQLSGYDHIANDILTILNDEKPGG